MLSSLALIGGQPPCLRRYWRLSTNHGVQVFCVIDTSVAQWAPRWHVCDWSKAFWGRGTGCFVMGAKMAAVLGPH